jgi:hypothetical protein
MMSALIFNRLLLLAISLFGLLLQVALAIPQDKIQQRAACVSNSACQLVSSTNMPEECGQLPQGSTEPDQIRQRERVLLNVYPVNCDGIGNRDCNCHCLWAKQHNDDVSYSSPTDISTGGLSNRLWFDVAQSRAS